MSTETFKEEILKQDSGSVPLIMMKFSHPQWASDLKIVYNTVDISTDDGVYEAKSFTFTPIAESIDKNSTTVVIEDISQEFIKEFRTYDNTGGDVSVQAWVVLSDTPNDVELGVWTFVGETATIAGSKVTVALTRRTILNNALGYTKVTATDFPGLYI